MKNWRPIKREPDLRVGMQCRATCKKCGKVHAFTIAGKRPGGRHESDSGRREFGWRLEPYPPCMAGALWVGLSGGCGNGKLRVKVG
jgi:hypothetical protein